MARGPVDPRLLRHSRASRTGVLLLVLLGIGQALATIGVILALSRIVVALFENHRLAEYFDVSLLAGCFLGRALLSWAEQIVAERTAAAVAQELRAAVLGTALRAGPAWVADFGTGRLATLLIGGLDQLRPWFAGYLPSLVLAVVLPPLVVVVMAILDPASALIAVLTLPLIPVFGALIGRATQRRAQDQWAASARLSGHFLDVVRGLGALRLYGRAERQVGVVREMTERHRSATVRVLRIAFLSSTALDLVATGSVGLIAVETGLRVAAGRLDLGPALLVILLAPEAYRPLREVGARFHAAADAGAVVTEVDEALSASGSAAPATTGFPTADAGPTDAVLLDAGPAVAAIGVRVRHPGARVDALDLPGLRVSGGEIVALRGPSGAGKTTALRALAGLQPLTAGSVAIGGPRPLYLPQTPTLPHARTVAEALLLDDEEPDSETASHTAIFASLAAVGLTEEVAALPGGLQAPLGEHGRGLSSGQRQRLALARLLRAARQRPAVLLLDEPTAHLDAAAEQRVIEELRAAARRGCAVLVVAHRRALLAAADRTIDVLPPTPPTHARSTPPALAPLARPGRVPAQRENSVGHTPTEFSRSGRGALVRPVGLGAGAWLAGVALTGAATWLLVRAASLPPVLSLSTAVVTVRASAVARPLLRYLERLASHEVGFARLGAWRSAVYADLIPRVPGAGLHRRGELLSRIVADVDLRVDGLLRGRLPAASAVLALATAVTVALIVSPVAVLALAPGLAVAVGLAPALAARRATRHEAATAQARAELADSVVETVEGIDELAGRGTGTALRLPLQRGRALARIEARAAATAGAATALAHLGIGLAALGTALAVAASIGTARDAELAAALLLGVIALSEPILALPEAATARRRARGAASRLAAVSATPPSTTAAPGPHRPSPAHAQPLAHILDSLGRGAQETISVRGLVAGWDRARPPALTGLDLELPPGSRIAVLGASGSGKSTLAAVLAGLLDPIAGSIQLSPGGGPAGIGAVAMVGDEVDHVFASSVRENLRLGRPDATDAELRAVLREVQLGDWLSGLPRELDTWLGEGGTTVSGGERRRLITARALLADPDLLILDEPTEGLDEPTAQALMSDLLRATRGRRVLLLTHRREGLDDVDAAYELVTGRLRDAPIGARIGAETAS